MGWFKDERGWDTFDGPKGTARLDRDCGKLTLYVWDLQGNDVHACTVGSGSVADGKAIAAKVFAGITRGWRATKRKRSRTTGCFSRCNL